MSGRDQLVKSAMPNREHFEQLREKNPFIALHEAICDQLMQDIISFHIAPGTWLIEKSIAEHLHTSRSPVHTALELLLRKGYVYQSGRHYYVKEFSAEEYRELNELASDHIRICDVLKMRDRGMAVAVARHHLSASGNVKKKAGSWSVTGEKRRT